MRGRCRWLRVAGLCGLALLVTEMAEGGKSKFNSVLAPGDAAPDWSGLAGIDGKTHSLGDFATAKSLVIVFTCNRCPVARAYEGRIAELARAWKDRGVDVVALSVSRHPADGLDKFKGRAQEAGFLFPCLSDPSQKVGKDYGVRVSLQVFVLDGERRIAYMGAFDDNLDPQKARRSYVTESLEAVLAGKLPAKRETLARGCPVEYAGETPSPADD